MNYLFAEQQKSQYYFFATRAIKTILLLALKLLYKDPASQTIKKVHNHPMRTDVVLDLGDNFLFLIIFSSFLFELYFFKILFLLMFGNIERNGNSIWFLSDNKFLIRFFILFNFFFGMIFPWNLIEDLLIFHVFINSIEVYTSIFMFCNHSQNKVEEMLKLHREFIWKIRL